MFPCSALLLCKAKNVLCFLHEWGLHPSYATDNGGKNGGNVGGTMVMSPVCPQFVPSFVPSLVTRRRKGCKYWCKRCNLQFKGCNLGWKGCKFGAKGYKSEEKGIKVIVFCRKDDFPSLFRGKLANFVRVFNYNKVQPHQNRKYIK